MKQSCVYLIDKLGDFFQTDGRYFFKNTFWLLFGQSMMSLGAFLSTVVMANYVSKHELGDFRFVISIYTTLTAIVMSGLSAAMMKSVVNEFDGSLEYALTIKKKYGLYAFLVGIVIACYFLFKSNLIIASSVFVASFFLMIIESYSLYSPYLQAKHEFKYSSINNGLVKLFSSGAVIAVSYFFPKTIYLIIAFYGSQAIINFLQYKILVKKFPVRNNLIDEKMLPYAKHMTLSGIGSFLFGQADKFILYHFFGPVTLASYWIASSIPQEAGRVVSTIGQVAFPRFVKADHAEAKKALPRKFLLATLMLFLISLVYAFVAKFAFQIFFPEYLSEVSKSIVLMFAFAITPHYFIWGYFLAKGRHKVIYFSSSIDPVLQISLCVALVPFYGIWGLVFAILIKNIIMNFLAFFVIKKY